MKGIFKSLVLAFMVLFFSFSLSGFLSYMPAHPRTGETVTFTLKPRDVLFSTITWNFGDGSPTQTTAKPNYAVTHVYAAAGTYMAVAEYGGVADSTLVTVTDPRRISFTPPSPKAGQAIAFAAENFYSACIRWDFGDGTFKNGTPGETHSYANAGTYPVRAFEECGATYGASVTVKVAQAEVIPPPPPVPKPSLAISFVSLHFADGKADVSVPKGSAALMAYADLQVEGSGILQWQWLVDDVIFKTDSLAVTFGNKFTIDSGKIPGLSTAVPGNHKVTLHFLYPEVAFRVPVISYFVALRSGPLPVVHKVTPETLEPGREYELEIQGANLTPDTEIVFAASLAVVKKANFLSPTQAKVSVFVPPTASQGSLQVSARNESGVSTGPGQVTIKTAQKPVTGKVLPKPPWTPPFGIIKGNGPLAALKKGLKINGGISFIDTLLHVSIWVHRYNLASQDYKPVSGAIVKVNGIDIPENLAKNMPGCYYLDEYNYPEFPVGQPVNISVSVDGKTYVGTSGPFSWVEFVYPKERDQVNIALTNFLDARWKWTGAAGPVSVVVYQIVNNQVKDLAGFRDVTADHVAIPCSGWPANVDLLIYLYNDFADFVFPATGELEENCKVPFNEYDIVTFHTNNELKPLNPVQKEQQPPLPPLPFPPKPSTEGLTYKNLFLELLKKTPRIEGAVNLSPSWTPGKVFLEACLAITLDGQTVNGADVKVNGVKLEQHQILRYYGLYAAEISYIPSGQVTVTVTVNGITYNGVGTYNNLVFFTKPPNHSSVVLPTQSQIYFQWQYNNGLIEPVDLIIQFSDTQKLYNIFAQGQIMNDHISVPTANIPSWPGYLNVWLCKRFPDIVFDGFAAYTANVKFDWGGPFGFGFHPQLTLYSGPIGMW